MPLARPEGLMAARLPIPDSRAAFEHALGGRRPAIALLDHVAQMDADAELDATLRRKTRVALDHAILHLDCAANGIDDASELNDAPVPGAPSLRDRYGH
jgi:hypothetical protein